MHGDEQRRLQVVKLSKTSDRKKTLFIFGTKRHLLEKEVKKARARKCTGRQFVPFVETVYSNFFTLKVLHVKA